MTVPHMTADYQAQPPKAYRDIFMDKAQEAREIAQAAQPGTWRDFCINQMRFWQRQAAMAS